MVSLSSAALTQGMVNVTEPLRVTLVKKSLIIILFFIIHIFLIIIYLLITLS